MRNGVEDIGEGLKMDSYGVQMDYKWTGGGLYKDLWEIVIYRDMISFNRMIYPNLNTWQEMQSDDQLVKRPQS